MTINSVEGAPFPGVSGLERYSVAVTGGVLHLIGSRAPNGAERALAMAFAPSGIAGNEVNTAITTVGAGVLTAAAIFGGMITRTGPTSAFTDTTDTAAAIQAVWPGVVGSSFEFTYINKTAFDATIAGGAGVTMAGLLMVPANSTSRYLAVWTGASTLTITSQLVSFNTDIPAAKFTTFNRTTGSLAAGEATGAAFVALRSTNATPGAQLVRSAAAMLADIPNGAVGVSWILRIINTGAGTLTLTADGGATVTLTGTMTVPTNTTRDFVVTITSPTTATIQTIGVGTIS